MKKCSECRSEFKPFRPMQKVCSPLCAAAHAKSKREKAERKQLKERKAAIKSRQQWLAEAQTAVNRYVRLRDHDKGCVSCDKPASWQGQWHASHFRSVGAASAVRFHLWNIHKACSVCNNYKSGNLSEYEPRLRKLIGDERVDWLGTQNQLVSYDIEYLARLKRIMNKKANRLQKRLDAR